MILRCTILPISEVSCESTTYGWTKSGTGCGCEAVNVCRETGHRHRLSHRPHRARSRCRRFVAHHLHHPHVCSAQLPRPTTPQTPHEAGAGAVLHAGAGAVLHVGAGAVLPVVAPHTPNCVASRCLCTYFI